MAGDAELANVLKPIDVGPEMANLARFHRDVSWIGTIVEGGMGPSTPKMWARGIGQHQLIQDGRWIVGTYEQDQFAPDGSFVLRWERHWVAGWDPVAGEYRATLADNYGHAELMRGYIAGDHLTFETLGDARVRLRLVWDVTDPADMNWRNEMAAAGSPWSLIEEYQLTPIALDQDELRTITAEVIT